MKNKCAIPQATTAATTVLCTRATEPHSSSPSTASIKSLKQNLYPVSNPLILLQKLIFLCVTFVFLLYIALIGWHNIVLVEQPITEKH